jgi:hypothetical protein
MHGRRVRYRFHHELLALWIVKQCHDDCGPQTGGCYRRGLFSADVDRHWRSLQSYNVPQAIVVSPDCAQHDRPKGNASRFGRRTVPLLTHRRMVFSPRAGPHRNGPLGNADKQTIRPDRIERWLNWQLQMSVDGTKSHRHGSFIVGPGCLERFDGEFLVGPRHSRRLLPRVFASAPVDLARPQHLARDRGRDEVADA